LPRARLLLLRKILIPMEIFAGGGWPAPCGDGGGPISANGRGALTAALQMIAPFSAGGLDGAAAPKGVPEGAFQEISAFVLLAALAAGAPAAEFGQATPSPASSRDPLRPNLGRLLRPNRLPRSRRRCCRF
jgi:hypothetical protein